MIKVCVFFAEGFEEIEALTVVDMLRRTNRIQVVMVSVTDKLEVTSAHNIMVKCDELFAYQVCQEADMLVLPGGMPGTAHLEEHEELKQMIREFFEQGKNIGAICAAPRILGKMGLLQGKNAVCFPGNESQLQGANILSAKAVTDENIITSKGMGTSIDFSLQIIAKLLDENEANALAKTIQFM